MSASQDSQLSLAQRIILPDGKYGAVISHVGDDVRYTPYGSMKVRTIKRRKVQASWTHAQMLNGKMDGVTVEGKGL